MADITQHHRFQRVLCEATMYRNLRAVFDCDPDLTPGTVNLLREFFLRDRNDPRDLYVAAQS
jgi:hypothetical protein